MYTVWFPVCMAVSRFLAKPIQMNFAENKSWPTSVAWRGRPTQVRAGSMRAGGPTGSGSNSSTVTAVCSALRMEGQLFLLSGTLWHSAFSDAALRRAEGPAILAFGHALASCLLSAALSCTISDRQPLCNSSCGFEEILVCTGHCSARRLPRNRSLRLHGVLEML